ncbi:MAG: hypothetical protein IJO27_03025, partial [Bacilli bacterium]|nr:hypothetical protein [Bacilli bacterium]
IELKKKISGLEGPIKGHERKEMDAFIKDKKKLLDGLYHILEICRIYEPNKYDELKLKVEQRQEEFDRIYDEYNGKCAFVVKNVRSVKKLYAKHKKLGLVSAGLSSLALLSSSFTLIPAIMHGNSVIANAVPSLKGMFNFFNNILSKIIGATFTKEGLWKLASGVVLTSKVATTALLKSLAMLSGGVVTLLTPVFIPQLINEIKKLVNKIRQSELKQKLSDAYHSGVNKVDEFKTNLHSRKR